MREIFVTNRNDFHHTDSFDGVVYDFPPNERVAIPVDAATHMFGFNSPDKTETLTRLGWATRFDPVTKQWADDPAGVKKLAHFVFTKAVMVEERIEVLDADTAPDGTRTEVLGRELDVKGNTLPKGSVSFLRADVLASEGLV